MTVVEGDPEGSLFDSYYTKVEGRVLLLSLDCSTLLLICTLKWWVFSKEASSTIFWVFSMIQPGIEPRSPRLLVNTLTIIPMFVFIGDREVKNIYKWSKHRFATMSLIFHGVETHWLSGKKKFLVQLSVKKVMLRHKKPVTFDFCEEDVTVYIVSYCQLLMKNSPYLLNHPDSKTINVKSMIIASVIDSLILFWGIIYYK